MWAFDPTPTVENNLDGLSKNTRFHFYPLGLSDKDGIETFFMPIDGDGNICASTIDTIYTGQNKKRIDVEMKRLVSIMKDIDLNEIDILKMDIEGSEFKVIPDIFSSGIFPYLICIEMHERFFENPKERFKEFMDLVKSNGYEIVWYSDSLHEFLLVKKK